MKINVNDLTTTNKTFSITDIPKHILDTEEYKKSNGIPIYNFILLIYHGAVSRMVVKESIAHIDLFVPKEMVPFMTHWTEIMAPMHVNWSVSPLNRPMEKGELEFHLDIKN